LGEKTHKKFFKNFKNFKKILKNFKKIKKNFFDKNFTKNFLLNFVFGFFFSNKFSVNSVNFFCHDLMQKFFRAIFLFIFNFWEIPLKLKFLFYSKFLSIFLMKNKLVSNHFRFGFWTRN